MTSDYIDRQAVLKAINNMVKECDSVYVTSALRNLEVIVADLPSAQPETHDKRTETHACDCGHAILWQLPRQDDWYCADAERRTDG